jgi:hypothetical protein
MLFKRKEPIMTLRDKRLIVEKFKDGRSIEYLCWLFNGNDDRRDLPVTIVEQVLRDFLNGKFSLRSKGSHMGRNRKTARKTK